MTLYVYDHCPYCVKARMIFGLKDLPFKMKTLLNDDVETPTNMIGKKMLPILEKDDGSYLPESMDIVHDVDATYGMKKITGDTNPDIEAWIAQARDYIYELCMPRWVEAPLDEFETEGARAFFTEKKEAMIGPFEEALARSVELKEQANEHLTQLVPLIRSSDAVNGTLSEDDFHLFAALRSLSIVKGLEYPEAVNDYRKRMAERSGVPLHDRIAR